MENDITVNKIKNAIIYIRFDRRTSNENIQDIMGYPGGTITNI
jgi:hypothetical protein